MYDYCLACRNEDDIRWVIDLSQRTGQMFWDGSVPRRMLREDPTEVVYVHVDIARPSGRLTGHTSHWRVEPDMDRSQVIELLHSPKYDHANMLEFIRQLPNRAQWQTPIKTQLPTDSPFCGVHPVKSKRKITPVPI